MHEKLKTLGDLADKQCLANSVWTRQILSLAAGGLALLVAFQPATPNSLTEKYLLAVTWIALGIGILSGASAAYSEVSLAKNLTEKYRKELHQILKERVDRPMPTIAAAPSLICRISKMLMIVSLLVAVVCLVGYAVTRTLSN